MIEFVCPSCRSGLRVGDDTAGSVVRCGSCLATVRVPDVQPEQIYEGEPVRPADRPRTRPPRRPPPPEKSSGRRTLIWILIVLAVFAVVILGVCGGIIVMLQPKWRAHESPQGGFKVDLPGDPRSDMRQVMTRVDPNFQIEGTVLQFQGEYYGVMYRDVVPRLRSDEKQIDEIVDGLHRDRPEITVVSSRPLTVSGFAAREVVLSHPQDGKAVWRIVAADTRLYLVFAAGRKADDESNKRVQRFMDSFAVTDPKLLARAGRRGQPKDPEPEPEPDDEPELDETLNDAARGGVRGAGGAAR